MDKKYSLIFALLQNDKSFLEEIDALLELDKGNNFTDADLARNIRIKHREYEQKAFDLKKASGLSYVELIELGV